MEINWPTIVTMGSIIGTILLVFKSLKSDMKDLRTEFKEFRSESKAELHAFRSEYRSELHEFRRESQENYNKLDNKIDHLGDRVGKVENRLTAIEAVLPYVKPKVIRFQEHHEDEPKEN